MKPRTAGIHPSLFPFLVTIAALALSASAGEWERPGKEPGPERDRRALDRLRSPPLGLPPVSEPENNPATIEKIVLGRKLFFDRRLSSNDTMSCAMCHIPEQGFTNNELSTPIGVNGRSLRRNAPAILNAAYAVHLFWDGRERSLESQAVAPLFARDEMANPSAAMLIAKVAGLNDYSGLFERAFGGGPTLERIGRAIAAWERTLLAGDAPFDRWRYGGDSGALTEEQKRGFELFSGEARCVSCHFVGAEHALFTDHSFHDTGLGYLRDEIASRESSPILVEIAPAVFVPVERGVVRQVGESRAADQGRLETTRDPADKWRYRTPSLRNAALTAPYMHDGSLPTLEAVIKFYNSGGVPHPGLSPMIRPLDLDDGEVASIAAFLRSLTSSSLAELIADARSVEVGN